MYIEELKKTFVGRDKEIDKLNIFFGNVCIKIFHNFILIRN